MKFAVIMLFFGGCNLRKSDDIIFVRRGFALKELSEFKVPLYEVSTEIHPILDSIIKDVYLCDRYKNAQIGFIFAERQDSLNRLIISIENVTSAYNVNHSYCTGVFYYQGYQFLMLCFTSESILKKLDKSVKLYGINSEQWKMLSDEHGEFFTSHWEYLYEDQKFKCISYSNCGSFWPLTD